jgi:hypothetical protein
MAKTKEKKKAKVDKKGKKKSSPSTEPQDYRAAYYTAVLDDVEREEKLVSVLSSGQRQSSGNLVFDLTIKIFQFYIQKV